jgi:hypothetical protein
MVLRVVLMKDELKLKAGGKLVELGQMQDASRDDGSKNKLFKCAGDRLESGGCATLYTIDKRIV